MRTHTHKHTHTNTNACKHTHARIPSTHTRAHTTHTHTHIYTHTTQTQTTHTHTHNTHTHNTHTHAHHITSQYQCERLTGLGSRDGALLLGTTHFHVLKSGEIILTLGLLLRVRVHRPYYVVTTACCRKPLLSGTWVISVIDLLQITNRATFNHPKRICTRSSQFCFN